jgi:cupin fold WbuC family metalloprotein
VKTLDDALTADLTARAAASPRLRAHHNLHDTLEDPVQRLLVAALPGTHIRPHCHPAPKWEMILALRGRLALVFFDDAGRVEQRLELSPDGPVTAVEIPPGQWHTLCPMGGPVTFLEMKPGPYLPSGPADFAAWAPAEGEADVPAFQSWLQTAATGDTFHP